MYKRKPFEAKHRNDEGNYKQVKLYEYWVKLYNKRLHYEKQGYDIGHEILRFELKINKMRMLANYKVFTLEDLLNNIEDIAKDMLPKAWMEVMLCDPTMNKQKKKHYNMPMSTFGEKLLKKEATTITIGSYTG
jgi:hypothetical protein